VPSAAIAPARRLGEDGLAPPPAALRMTGRATIADWWGGASNNLRGSIILLVAIASFTAMTVLIKVAGQRIPLVEILTVRQLVMQLLIAPFSVADFPAVLRTRDPFLQIGRGLLQLGAMLCSFAAVIYLPLALSMALSFSYALFVTVGAGLLLKETVGLGRVAVMLQPAGDASLAYSLVAILGAVFAAASAVSLRAVSGFERADTILTYQALVLLTALAIPTALVWVTPTFGELIILLAVGVSGTLGQWLLTVAYKRGEAAALAPLDFVRLLLTAACGFVLFGESLEISELAGAVILIAATAYTFRVNARRIRRVPLPGRSAVN
jgi:drug/metabolite transporter (DMT)-like permease